MEPVTISAILSSITSLVTTSISWVGLFVDAIVGSPLLLMFVVLGMVGLGISLIRRIIG